MGSVWAGPRQPRLAAKVSLGVLGLPQALRLRTQAPESGRALGPPRPSGFHFPGPLFHFNSLRSWLLSKEALPSWAVKHYTLGDMSSSILKQKAALKISDSLWCFPSSHGPDFQGLELIDTTW